jgi:glycosyltransferase involved in cell wall biosynthesis
MKIIIPEVSVFLPTYNRCSSGSLERAIKSVCEQTYKNFEFFIIDDGSVDRSKKLINDYKKEDPRIKSLNFERNIGLPALTLGHAFLESKGNYITWVFDDCVLYKNHLEILLNEYKKNPELGMIYGKAVLKQVDQGDIILGKKFDPKILPDVNFIANGSVMVKREVVDDIGYYDPHVILKRCCDWDLWKRIAKKYEVGFVDKIISEEYGLTLTDSLGNTHTHFQNIVKKYSDLDRNRLLKPENIERYDPFNLKILKNLTEAEKKEAEFLVIEHFVRTKNISKVITYAIEYLNNSNKIDENEKILWKQIKNMNSKIENKELLYIYFTLINYFEKRISLINKEHMKAIASYKILEDAYTQAKEYVSQLEKVIENEKKNNLAKLKVLKDKLDSIRNSKIVKISNRFFKKFIKI